MIEQLQKMVRPMPADGMLFTAGGRDIGDAGKAKLAKVAPALKGMGSPRIVSEGFTDAVPTGPAVRGRSSSNVEQSMAHAKSLAAL